MDANSVVNFKKPTCAAIKQKILTEEAYIEEMAKIIQRDFFPDLEKLRVQNAYLDAMDRRDFVEMEAIKAKYSCGSNRRSKSSRLSCSMTPLTFETPSSMIASVACTPLLSELPCGNNTQNNSVTANQKNNDAPNNTDCAKCKPTTTITNKNYSADGNSSVHQIYSLDAFLNAHTSEDNHSFQEIIRIADEKMRTKFSVLYKHEQLSAEKLARALTLPTIEEQFNGSTEGSSKHRLETWTYTNKNSIMYVPDGVTLTANEQVEGANSINTVIQHKATRLGCNPFGRITNSGGRAPQMQTATNSNVAGGIIDVQGKVNATPQIRGFNLVQTPSPRPGEAFSPLMTWGEIDGTPFRLSGDSDATPINLNAAGPAFKITANSRRENIAIALAEKVAEKMRVQKQQALNTAKRNINSPLLMVRSKMDRLASMSPAARRLATTKLGLRSPSLTPKTATRRPISLETRKKHTSNIAIEGVSAESGSSCCGKSPKATSKSITFKDNQRNINNGNVKTSTLTDNLLKIPLKKRCNAVDFF